MSRLHKSLSGAAGHYLVAAELSRRGYIATITLRNAKGVDVLATDQCGSRTVAIQVKTNKGSHQKWMLRAPCNQHSPKFFYVFVNLNLDQEDPRPKFYVVKSSRVAKATAASHAKHLSSPGRDGRPHKDTPMRIFRDRKGRYLDAWHLLRLDDAHV